MAAQYSVEKIVRRGHCNGEVVYYVKYENYPMSECSWVSPNNLIGCEHLIEEYEVKMGHKIVGVKNVNGGYRYLLKFKDAFPDRDITEIEAKEKFPDILIEFLENHIEMYDDARSRNMTFQPNEVSMPIGRPLRIDYASNLVGDVDYWYTFPGNEGLFSNENKWHTMKIGFLERRMTIESNSTNRNYFVSLPYTKRNKTKRVDDGIPMENIFIGSRMLTRKVLKALNDGGFSMPKIRIARKLPYEKLLLFKARKVNRRRTIGIGAAAPRPILNNRGKSLGGPRRSVYFPSPVVTQSHSPPPPVTPNQSSPQQQQGVIAVSPTAQQQSPHAQSQAQQQPPAQQHSNVATTSQNQSPNIAAASIQPSQSPSQQKTPQQNQVGNTSPGNILQSGFRGWSPAAMASPVTPTGSPGAISLRHSYVPTPAPTTSGGSKPFSMKYLPQ